MNSAPPTAEMVSEIDDQSVTAFSLLLDVIADRPSDDGSQYCFAKVLDSSSRIGGALLIRSDWTPAILPAVGDELFLPKHFGSETVKSRLIGAHWTTLLLQPGTMFDDAVKAAEWLKLEIDSGWGIAWVGGWLLDEIGGKNLRSAHELLMKYAEFPYTPFGRLMEPLGLLQPAQQPIEFGFESYESFRWGVPRPTPRQFKYAINLKVPLTEGMTKDEMSAAISAAVNSRSLS